MTCLMSASFTAVRSFHNKKPAEENTARRPTGDFPVKRGLVLLFLLGAAFLAQLAGALFPAPVLFLAGSAGGLLLELYILRRRPYLVAALGRLRFDVTTRQLLRDALIVVGLVRLPGIDPLEEQPLALALLAGYFLHFCCQAISLLIRRRRTLPFVTRNIDASALRLSAAPPRLLARQPSRRLLYFALPATAGLMASALTTDGLWGLLGVGLTLLLHLGGILRLAAWLRPGAQPVNEQQALEWLDRWLAEYRPTVAMYFSGGAASAYQANMWLGTLSELEARPLIVLRERFMVQKIDATDVPIVCIPKVAHLMRLEHSSLKMMLHPANSGKTSQVLRIPSIKHAFINHGESDKLSSCNPYAKAYDEVWVAGRAARDRYRLADIGVDDRDVVEVGRPQLAPIRPYAGPPASDGPVTVLYAPTWEGWTDDPGNTSVILAGENIVRALLADPKVRLLYKPHPMTGSVDPRAARADERIQQMIAEANARRSGPRPGPEAAAELARRTAELDELTSTAFRPSADEMERMLLQSTPRGDREAAVAAATAAWEEAYWASFPDWEHLVITGPRPALYACFNRSDLLISDVSSVVSDWLASEKPYAVANTSGLAEEEFRAGLPTVRAATILTPDAAGVPALLESVRDPSRDTMARARTELKTHLLGPADPPSIVRFDQAVAALCAKADRRRELMALRTDDAPAPRVAAEATEAAEAGQESDPSDSENSLTT
ncbi:hypothetical protein ACG5V6_15825 [Streptomyces chitinivorans]|uniref:Integral membrane protein n=1 Tax=Streptomyces chitinivorans TaxID=1257027 RepID=A0ABW7HVS4_9ACTN|nr:hypothetical protein [Streptomyces chitinivorans]MDH2407730.1 hypothetical protein [Streptomyces chitinivorans]